MNGETEPEGSTTKTFIAITVVILILFAVVFFFRSSASEEADQTLVYNGFSFAYADGLWYTQWERGGRLYNVLLHYNPEQVEDLTITGRADERFQQQVVFVTLDPEGSNTPGNDSRYLTLSAIELTTSMINAFDLTPVVSCTRNTTASCANKPIVTCENTNASVIYLRQATPAKIEFDGNCLTIQGPDEELLRATERLMYSWYRILR
jgi:hypothetical protein